jgi:hypothetical protein
LDASFVLTKDGRKTHFSQTEDMFDNIFVYFGCWTEMSFTIEKLISAKKWICLTHISSCCLLA